MADFEDDGSSNLANATGMTDDYPVYDPADHTQMQKPSDPSFDPFSSQPSSFSQSEADHNMSHFQNEADVPPANENAYPDYQQNPGYSDDLPANFAREAATRNQGAPSDLADDEQQFEQGRDDEADFFEGGAADGSGSNPFSPPQRDDDEDDLASAPQPGQELGQAGEGDERPIVGYNPFLEEMQNKTATEDVGRQRADEEEEAQGMYEDSSEEEDDDEDEDDRSERALVPGDSTDSYVRPPQEPESEPNAFDQAPVNVHKFAAEDEEEEHENGRGDPHHYERLQEDEEEEEERGDEDDSADLEMDPVERVQPMREEEKDLVEEATESRPVDDLGAMEGVEEAEVQQPQQATQPFPQEPGFDREEEEEEEVIDRQVPGEEESFVQKTEIDAVESAPGQFADEQMVEDSSRLQDSVPAVSIDDEALYQGGIPAAVSQAKGDEFEEENAPELQIKSDEFEEEKPVGDVKDLGIINQGFTDDVDMDEREEAVEQEDEEKDEAVEQEDEEKDEAPEEDQFNAKQDVAQSEMDGFREQEQEQEGGQEQPEGFDREEQLMQSSEAAPVESAWAPGAPPTFDDDVMAQRDDVVPDKFEEEPESFEPEAKEIAQAAPAAVVADDYNNQQFQEEEREEEKKEEMEYYEREEEKEEKREEFGFDREEEKREEMEYEREKDEYQKEKDEEEEEEKYAPQDTEGFGSRVPTDFGEEKIAPSFAEREEAGGFVENLSGRESPEVVPQPLPSPPEPKQEDMSSFDPLAPQPDEDLGYPTGGPSPSTCRELNLGQAGTVDEDAFFGQTGTALDETCSTAAAVVSSAAASSHAAVNGGDFLTAGEVEGETRFDVDGSAVTSTATEVDVSAVNAKNNPFLSAGDEEEEEEEEDEEEEEEEDEESQPMDQGPVTNTYTGTTETSETSAEDRSGVEDESAGQDSVSGGQDSVSEPHPEGNDNPLMSMSMEGSFYDDGGDIIGGTDGHEGQVKYQAGDPITEESSSYDGFTPKTDSFLADQDQFNQLQDEFRDEPPPAPAAQVPVTQAQEADLISAETAFQEQSQPPVVNGGVETGRQDEFDSLVDAVSDKAQDDFDPMVSGSSVAQSGVDSLLDAPVTDQGLQTPVTEQSTSSAVDSFADSKPGIDSLVNEFDSSVDYNPPSTTTDNQSLAEAEVKGESSIDDATGAFVSEPLAKPDELTSQIVPPEPEVSDAAPAKPEEPSSSVDEVIASKEIAQTAAAAAAPAATPAAAAAPAATAAAASAKTTTTTTKKTTAKAGAAKTTMTTTTTTKTTRETKTANGRAAAAKKTETVTTTTTKSSSKKPADSARPASARSTTASKTATSPTKPPSSAPSSKPLPSYAQPITPRKPREPKFQPGEEKTPPKKPATPRSASSSAPRPASASTTTSSSTSRPASSTTPRTPRTQSATASSAAGSSSRSSSRTLTTTSTSTTRTTTKTSTPTSRPKSSPTKLSNGTQSDSTTTTKKYGIDSRNDGYKPGGGSVRVTSEKREVKATSRVDSGAKTGAASGARSPTKPTTPRTPGSGSKTGEAKSKIGSFNNATHTPGGGNVRITTKKTDYSSVSSRVGSKDKMDHKPGGGAVRIENRKVKVEAKSKIGSLDNASHKPSGGDKKIESQKLDFKEKASPKVGSIDKTRLNSGGSDTPSTEAVATNGTPEN